MCFKDSEEVIKDFFFKLKTACSNKNEFKCYFFPQVLKEMGNETSLHVFSPT